MEEGLKAEDMGRAVLAADSQPRASMQEALPYRSITALNPGKGEIGSCQNGELRESTAGRALKRRLVQTVVQLDTDPMLHGALPIGWPF
jgi:hypothetical protein